MMFRRILVPTDGSALAERSFPLAERIALSQGASVVLARVVPPITWLGYDPTAYGTPNVYQELFDTMDDDCRRYLGRAADRFHAVGIDAETEMRHGIPGAALLDLEEQLGPDLVVMGTHGHSGLARFAMGSVADLMVRDGTAPVLLVRAFAPALSALLHALVPLDGSALAETALPMVEALAIRPVAEVQLLRAVNMESDRAIASLYLDGIANRLRAYGVKVKSTIVVAPAVEAIARAAERADLVVISTHGRGGFERIRYGSVATDAIRNLATPTLLVRVRPLSIPAVRSSDAAEVLV
jgi:nucleotide-binding universal stress UspA family protein